MRRNSRTLALVVCSLWGAMAVRAAEPPSSEATITSDQMELLDQGAKTIFTGHVRLDQASSWIVADKMVRTKATSIVDAEGHIKGFWKSPQGEKIIATGQRARYDPGAQVTELWGRHATLTRWQTEADTAPVVITALYFRSQDVDQTLWAKDKVHVNQGKDFWARSDEAKYDHREKLIHLWGKRKTVVHFENEQGKGHFLSRRALISVASKKAKLLDEVRGRMTPVAR